MADAANDRPLGFADRTTPGRRAVDWIIAGMLVLIGLAIAGMGGLLVSVANRARFADWVAEGTVDPGPFTPAEMVDVLFAATWWGGIAVILAGLVVVVGGVAFGVGRHRIDRAGDAAEPPTFLANALLGAVVTVMTSFVPFSGAIGGGLAGYLETDDSWSGALVGGTAAVLLAVPFAIVLLALVAGLAAEGNAALGVVFLILSLVGFAFSIGVGALGGAVGAYLRGRR